jgi:hypothetical protein
MSDDLLHGPVLVGRPAARPATTPLLLLDDRFTADVAPGAVVGSRATSGPRRLGTDRERAMAVDHGQLRVGWLAHGGWGRASLAYGPFADPSGLVLVVRAMNGLTTSQTDWRPEGRRAMVRRWLHTFPRATLRRPQLRTSFMVGWFEQVEPGRAPAPIAAVTHRAGARATGELWFEAGPHEVRLSSELQNLPATYVIGLGDGTATLHAWSHPGAEGFADPGDPTPLARLPVGGALPPAAFAGVHQSILGEVRYRLDTRVERVQVWRRREPGDLADDEVARRWWSPRPAAEGRTVTDAFEGVAGDLAGRTVSPDGPTWARVHGTGVFETDGAGRARVRASLEAPNPGRTAYCVPWDVEPGSGGVEVAATIVPPGTERGEGHQGRSGLVLWQDADNHLVVNHFIDDGSAGVSISAFLRTGGHEAMFDWDAVWSNVGTRVRWGVPFRLSVACDGHRFLCRVDGEPVLYRALTDYRTDAAPLGITAVGLVANWEWGDDTGTTFEGFSARELAPAEQAWAEGAP